VNALKQILLVIIILYSPVSIILLRLLPSELLPGRELLDKLVSFNIIYGSVPASDCTTVIPDK